MIYVISLLYLVVHALMNLHHVTDFVAAFNDFSQSAPMWMAFGDIPLLGPGVSLIRVELCGRRPRLLRMGGRRSDHMMAYSHTT